MPDAQDTQAPSRSKAAEVFGITELLEHILILSEPTPQYYVPQNALDHNRMKQLFQLQCVNKDFRSTILGSTALRRAIGFEKYHDDVSTYARVRPLCPRSVEDIPAMVIPSLRPVQLVHPFLETKLFDKYIRCFPHRVRKLAVIREQGPYCYACLQYPGKLGALQPSAKETCCHATLTPLAVKLRLTHSAYEPRGLADGIRSYDARGIPLTGPESFKKFKVVSARVRLEMKILVKLRNLEQLRNLDDCGENAYMECLVDEQGDATVMDMLVWLNRIVSRTWEEHLEVVKKRPEVSPEEGMTTTSLSDLDTDIWR